MLIGMCRSSWTADQCHAQICAVPVTTFISAVAVASSSEKWMGRSASCRFLKVTVLSTVFGGAIA